MEKIKVAILVWNIINKAGTERAVCNLTNLLIKYGDYAPAIVTVNGTTDSIPAYKVERDVTISHLGIHINHEERKNRVLKIIKYIKLIKKLSEYCQSEKIDIIIGTTYTLNMLLAFVHCRKLQKIGAEHINYGFCSFSHRIARRVLYPFLKAVVVLTKQDAKNYFFLDNIVVIPNAISRSSNSLSILENNILIAIGRLTCQKGFDLLIEAVNQIKNNLNDWQVRIIGDGEDKIALTKKVNKYKLDNIISFIPATGSIDDEYLNASIYAMTSRFEGLPMVLLEAKSFGVPVVSFDCPCGPAEVVRNGIDGFLVEPNNIPQFAEKLLLLIKNPGLRKQFGEAAVKDCERFSEDRVFGLWDALFKKLTKH